MQTIKDLLAAGTSQAGSRLTAGPGRSLCVMPYLITHFVINEQILVTLLMIKLLEWIM